LAARNEPADPVNQRLRQLRQIGQRTLLDFAALAIALTQQDRLRRLSVRDGVDEHIREESRFAAFAKPLTCTHTCKKDSHKARPSCDFQVEESKTFGLSVATDLSKTTKISAAITQPSSFLR